MDIFDIADYIDTNKELQESVFAAVTQDVLGLGQ
jgi:hypothetical protein